MFDDNTLGISVIVFPIIVLLIDGLFKRNLNIEKFLSFILSISTMIR